MYASFIAFLKKASYKLIISGIIFSLGFSSNELPTSSHQKEEMELKVENSVSISDKMPISASWAHSCAITSDGAVYCWGNNQDGQLGNGTTTPSLFPVNVTGLSSGVSAISAGGLHTCALTSSGAVKCWGRNANGQLGSEMFDNYISTPVDVVGLSSGVISISASAGTAGANHTCAVTSEGAVKCWGYNRYGQLGDGTVTDRYSPIISAGFSSGVFAVSAGGLHTCILTTQGSVKCWGDYGGWRSILGDGSTGGSLTPVDVVGLSSGVIAISAGQYHTCALTYEGAVKCWGLNHSGQLGDGTTSPQPTPVDVIGLSSGVVSISSGGEHTCAILFGGAMKCWGRNPMGQLGDGTTNNSSIPVDVFGLSSDVIAISAGYYHTCALKAVGIFNCWGWNDGGQLGDSTTISRLIPVKISFMKGIVLTPATTELPYGEIFTVTATIKDQQSTPQPGIQVIFSIDAGPNAGAFGMCDTNIPVNCTTDGNGQVSFSYLGRIGGIGTDQIKGCFIDQFGHYVCSQVVTINWIDAPCTTIQVIDDDSNNVVSGNVYDFHPCEAIIKIQNNRGYWVNFELTPFGFVKWELIGDDLDKLYDLYKVLPPNESIEYKVEFTDRNQYLDASLDVSTLTGEGAKVFNGIQAFIDIIPGAGLISKSVLKFHDDIYETFVSLEHLNKSLDALFSMPPNWKSFRVEGLKAVKISETRTLYNKMVLWELGVNIEGAKIAFKEMPAVQIFSSGENLLKSLGIIFTSQFGFPAGYIRFESQ